jgi:RNA polymerase sigma-70 factor (ECF subfamily)
LTSHANVWRLTRPQFFAAIERSVCKRFADQAASAEAIKEYLNSLYLDDLVLAAACLEGSEPAWEHFIGTYRGYLRAAAGSITRGSRSGTDAQELADSLFAELFGLVDGKRGEASLFRYFHGRSSLKTWLRTILAQRHIDAIRKSRRWSSLEQEDGEEAKPVPSQVVTTPSLDPHRSEYLQHFLLVLSYSLDSLPELDRKRLELYYAREKTLAEIARSVGEHESSASRHLERIRRELRMMVEQCLRSGLPARAVPAMSEAEIALCFQYAAEDAPIDFRQIFPQKVPGKPEAGRKESP